MNIYLIIDSMRGTWNSLQLAKEIIIGLVNPYPKKKIVRGRLNLMFVTITKTNRGSHTKHSFFILENRMEDALGVRYLIV